MFSGLVACRAGMGSSVLLKIKLEQVIKENNYPIKLEHGNLDSLAFFNGDLLVTMEDLADELRDKYKFQVIGIRNIVNKEEINTKLKEFVTLMSSK